MFGKDYQTLAAEFKLSQSLRPDIKQSVYHISLSLDPTEKLKERAWKEVAQKYLEKMGFKNSQFVAVKHRDRSHSHLHIVTSKIDLDGHVVNSSYDYYRSQTIIRDIEREYKLKQLQNSWECARHQQPRHEIEVLNKTWDNSVRKHLQKTLDEIVDFNSRLTVPQLLKQLDERQISHQVHYANTGAVRGLSYSYNGINYSGTSLGRAYTFPGLQKHRGIVCDSTIEREIYFTCTISPDTTSATIELLQQRELQQQQLDVISRRAIELKLIRREEERIRRSQEKELKRIKLEKEREKQRIAALNKEIKDLAPIFNPCIQYTHLQGVPISEATAFKALNHIHKTIWNEPVEDGLCVETKNYIITIKANTKNEPILSPNDQLEIGLNCCQLRVERKDNYEEILSINYRDYEELDTNNIYVVENQLTTDDQQRLKSLQKAVNDYQQELERIRLQNSPYTGAPERIKEAVLKIFTENGRDDLSHKVKKHYESKNLSLVWTEQLEYGVCFHQQLRVFQKNNDNRNQDQLILEYRGQTHTSCWQLSQPDWQLTQQNLSGLNAQRLFDLELHVNKRLRIKNFKKYAKTIQEAKGQHEQYSHSRGVYQNERYHIKVDRDRVVVSSVGDARGVIYETSNQPYSDPVKTTTINKFLESDYEWFENAHKKVENHRQQAERLAYQREQEKQQQRERERERGYGGFEL